MQTDQRTDKQNSTLDCLLQKPEKISNPEIKEELRLRERGRDKETDSSVPDVYL